MAGRFIFEQGSLAHLPVVMDCVERHAIDRIFHLGGMLSLPSENNPWGAFDANVVGTWNILEAARIKKMRQVVYGSTIATYSKDIPGDTIDDRTIQRPSSFYGITKTFGELHGPLVPPPLRSRLPGRAPALHRGAGREDGAHVHLQRLGDRVFHQGAALHPELRPRDAMPRPLLQGRRHGPQALAAADPARILTRVYNIAGITPPFSARELVDAITQRIPGAQLSFKPDPVVVELLRELGTLKISDECARTEWGWQLAYPLEAMVDDFIGEFEKNKSYFL